MTGIVTREEGRAWVRVALIKSAAQEAAEARRIARLKYEMRYLPGRIRALRSKLAVHEQRARELGIEA
jgi:hypothetical protein